jgi:hypothetical protein
MRKQCWILEAASWSVLLSYDGGCSGEEGFAAEGGGILSDMGIR